MDCHSSWSRDQVASVVHLQEFIHCPLMSQVNTCMWYRRVLGFGILGIAGYPSLACMHSHSGWLGARQIGGGTARFPFSLVKSNKSTSALLLMTRLIYSDAFIPPLAPLE